MRVLFFDDEEIRFRRLQEKSEGAALDWSATVGAAKKSLTEEVFDVVCLDHDIGGQMLACTENCGCMVAEFIKTLPAARVPLIVIVHSWNPDGATRMMGILDGQGVWETFRAPFGSFFFRGKEIVLKP